MKGYIRKRGNTYSYTVDIGRDPATGKRKQKTKGGFKTKKAAQEALNALVYEVNKGVYVVDSKSTVREICEQWLDIMKPKWKPATFVTNANAVENWIIKNIGNLKVQDVKPIHGSQLAKVFEENLAPSTARRMFSVSRHIFKFAVDMEIIQKNPLANIPMPAERKSEKGTWTFAHIKTFLRAAMFDNPFYHNVVALAVFTGMRKGEIFGLRIQDVDFEKNIIRVRQSLGETGDHGLYFTDLKNDSSMRDIWMDETIVRVLKDQIRRTKEFKFALGPDYVDHDLVFCTKDGTPYRPSGFNKPFNRLTRKTGVPQIRFHDLRHTHATLLLEIGVNHKVIAQRLGHSDIRTTLNTYSHVTPTMQENAMNGFKQAFEAN